MNEVEVALLGVLATLLIGFMGGLQWWISERARSRRRDTEMYAWGSNVISVMSRIEMTCEFRLARTQPAVLALAAEASSLVDQGRLFFPNVSQPDDEETSSRGLRAAILDEVVRAYFAAKHLYGCEDDGLSLKSQMRAARRRFVSLLQSEMGSTMRKSAANAAGISIPTDPSRW
ncbi:hypothetical protein [Phenylobacterium sp.]|uniref:hypothetical protein n=1 Tax=Phenylobacterium sp. TaxID=1871053 RepID=UPI0035B40A11